MNERPFSHAVFAILLTLIGYVPTSYANTDINAQIAAKLKRAGVNADYLDGIGHILEIEGTHRLNKIAARVKKRYRAYILLDTRDGIYGTGEFSPLGNYVRVETRMDNIDNLIEWRPSPIQTTLMHEIIHAKLRRVVDESGVITPLSMHIVGKDPGSSSAFYNSYYFGLDLQEFVTFSKALRLTLRNHDNPDLMKERLYTLSKTIKLFGSDAESALKYMIKNLNSGHLTYLVQTDAEIRPSDELSELLKSDDLNKSGNLDTIRYLKIASEVWNVFVPIDSSQSIEQNKLSLLSRLEETKRIVSELTDLARVINLNIGKESPDFKKITELVQKMNQVALNGYKPGSLTCSSLLVK